MMPIENSLIERDAEFLQLLSRLKPAATKLILNTGTDVKELLRLTLLDLLLKKK